MFFLTKIVIFIIFQRIFGHEQENSVETQENHLTEVVINVLKMPETCERQAKAGDLLTVHYNGSFAHNNREFDSSHKRGTPLNFQLGFGEVIPGWEKGLVGMCKGEVRRLTIPPHLGYGTKGTKVVPGDATLYFEVELQEIADGEKPKNIFKHVDVNNDKKLTKEEVEAYIRKQAGVSKTALTQEIIDQMLRDIFDREDFNKDSLISIDEFSGPKHDEF